MNIIKYLSEAFDSHCSLTDHAKQRLNLRFLSSELIKIKYLISAGIKSKPLKQWDNREIVAIVDPKSFIGLVCEYNQEKDIISIITFIRGKEITSYKDCEVISVSISKEKAQEEAKHLNEQRFKLKKITF